MAQYPSYTRTQARPEAINAFMRGVYGWMSLGLLITAGLSWFVANTPAVLSMLVTPEGGVSMGFWVLCIAEIGLVFYLSARINKLSASAASGLFIAYSALNGVTLSFIFLAYTAQSIVSTFVVCAGMFGAMSLYGLLTKRDLTSMGSFMMMGLIGLLIAMVVNIFLKSPMMQFVISGLGVVIFLGLTAYDTQKLRVMGEMAPADDGTAVRRGTIMGALSLYLDFINLFLFLLRFMGSSRN